MKNNFGAQIYLGGNRPSLIDIPEYKYIITDVPGQT